MVQSRTNLNYEKYRSAFENLDSGFNKLSKKNKNWGLIKLREYVACLIFELEIIESEDCTQEMDDMAGYVNMMEAGTGSITCVNTHLAKEKSKMFNEIKNYVKEHTHNYRDNTPREMGPSMANHSMILGDIQRKSTIMHRSQILNRTSTMAPNFSPQMFNKQNNLEQSQIIHSSNSPGPVNNSMYMNSTNNFGSLAGSQVFPSNPNNYLNPVSYGRKQNFKRRPTTRQSVLQTFQKFKTMKQGINDSMISSRTKNSEADNYSIYTKSKMSNNRVNV